MGPEAWEGAARVLAVRLDGMGDVLMTGPAIRALRDARPGRRVTLLTSPAGAEVARLMPGVDEVIVHEPPWMKATPPRASSASDHALLARLREGGFDGAVVFAVHTQSPVAPALLCYLADIPLRLAHCRENSYQLLTDWVREPEPEGGLRHEVRRQLDLVAHAGCAARDERLRVAVPPEAAEAAGEALARRGLGDRPWAVLHPGATAPSRRYPPAAYAAVARTLVRVHGWRVVLVGGPGDAATLDAIAAAAPVERLDGSGVEGLAALLARAPMLIANNSGPAHLAAAVGTPVVSLYALTNLQHAPWRVPGRVLARDVPCRECLRSVCPEGHHRCLEGVPPEAVVRAALNLMRELRSGAAAPLPDEPARLFPVRAPLAVVR